MTAASHKFEVGRRLKIAIEALGMPQLAVVKSLSRDTGVTASKLGNWLRGSHYPDEWFIKCFCDRYGITADWIYRGVVSGVSSVHLADELWRAESASQGVRKAPADPAP